MALIFENGCVFDTRRGTDLPILSVPSVCYTLLSDDITTGEKPCCTPYLDREDKASLSDSTLCFNDTLSTLCVSTIGEGLCLDLSSRGENLSELGLVLPFDFMGKRGGKWDNQLLFNSPYISQDRKIIYSYLSSPSGNDIIVAMLSEGDGWKMDYSPYSFGHYFISLRLFSSLDKAFGTGSTKRSLRVAILPCSGFDNALFLLSKLYGVPFIDYDLGGGKIGEAITLTPYGEIDSLLEVSANGQRVLDFSSTYTLTHEGEVRLIPMCKGVRGADATLYAYDDLLRLYKRSMDTVSLEIIKNHTDSNLCEHQCWSSAMLRYLIRFGDTLSESERRCYEDKVRSLLDIITEPSIERATPRITIMREPHDGFGAYNVFKSCRVQELFFGITILLDAYKYFKNPLYYEYAVGATDCLINNYQGKDGRIFIDWKNGSVDDYSTVCSPMIPLVDMALFINDKDPSRSSLYLERASALASYLYKRGLCFPTEGCVSSLAEAEMEDGSISCTALSLLYYCKNVRFCEDYITKAREILDIHNAWIIKAPICQMHGSTLRWWETQWEGDADGPAICAGHAWSIWRAEADFLMYELSGSYEHLLRAKNGFMTNFSKIDKNGVSYAIYSPDEINGGGFHSRSDEIKITLAPRFPRTPDCGLSRYVWIRANQTLLK